MKMVVGGGVGVAVAVAVGGKDWRLVPATPLECVKIGATLSETENVRRNVDRRTHTHRTTKTTTATATNG